MWIEESERQHCDVTWWVNRSTRSLKEKIKKIYVRKKIQEKGGRRGEKYVLPKTGKIIDRENK